MHSEELYGAFLIEHMPPCDPSAPPRNAVVTLNSDLLRIAEELGMDISAACERALTEQVRKLLLARWRLGIQMAAAAPQASLLANGASRDLGE
jgi:post-segregation antitoxin (ccd killing protein)